MDKAVRKSNCVALREERVSHACFPVTWLNNQIVFLLKRGKKKKEISKCRSCCGWDFGKINELPTREQQLIIEREESTFLTSSSKGNFSCWFNCKDFSAKSSHLLSLLTPYLDFLSPIASRSNSSNSSRKGNIILSLSTLFPVFCPLHLCQLTGFVLSALFCILCSWKRSQSLTYDRCYPKIPLISIRSQSFMESVKSSEPRKLFWAQGAI